MLQRLHGGRLGVAPAERHLVHEHQQPPCSREPLVVRQGLELGDHPFHALDEGIFDLLRGGRVRQLETQDPRRELQAAVPERCRFVDRIQRERDLD